MHLHQQCLGYLGNRGDLGLPSKLEQSENKQKEKYTIIPPGIKILTQTPLFIAEAVAYEWGVNGGVMKYTYPSDKRPDTSEDVLSLGFISPSFDAVLVRVDSDPKMNNDYLQLEIVSTSYSLIE